MRQWQAWIGRLFPRWQEIGWAVTALACWCGFFLSLPGYYLWFIKEPILQHFNNQQLAFTFASGAASILCALTSLILAIFLFIRKPGDRGAGYVSLFLLLYGFMMAGPLEMAEYALTGQTLQISVRVQAIFFTIPLFLLFLTFPNGVITPSAFRWLIFLALPTIPLLVSYSVVEINSINTLRSQITYFYLSALMLPAIGSQVYRYFWKSKQVERQQTKIVLFGIGIQTMLIVISGIIYTRLPVESYGTVNSAAMPMSLLWWGALAVLPVSFTLAILRSHLWDIDIVIRRTLVYGFLTVTLALVYAGSVLMLQYFFRLVVGHESPIAVILSTLGIYALFNPLRGGIQAAIDRRFYRSKYNTEQALERFQNSLRAQVDLEQVEEELTGIVQSTIQPEWIALWIRKPGSGAG